MGSTSGRDTSSSSSSSSSRSSSGSSNRMGSGSICIVANHHRSSTNGSSGTSSVLRSLNTGQGLLPSSPGHSVRSFHSDVEIDGSGSGRGYNPFQRHHEDIEAI